MRKKSKVIIAVTILAATSIFSVTNLSASKQAVSGEEVCRWDQQTDCTEPKMTLNCTGCN